MKQELKVDDEVIIVNRYDNKKSIVKTTICSIGKLYLKIGNSRFEPRFYLNGNINFGLTSPDNTDLVLFKSMESYKKECDRICFIDHIGENISKCSYEDVLKIKEIVYGNENK